MQVKLDCMSQDRICAVCGRSIDGPHMRGVIKGTDQVVLICVYCAEEAYLRARIARDKATEAQKVSRG